MKFGGFAFEDVNVLIPQMPEKEPTYESGTESMMDANMLEIELNDINAAMESIVFDLNICINSGLKLYGLEADDTVSTEKEESGSTEKKEAWYKRAWKAIKSLFERLGDYIRTFWGWIVEKFKKLKGGIRGRLRNFSIKMAWYHNIISRLKSLFKGKKGGEITEEQVDNVVDDLESDMKAQAEAVRDGVYPGFESAEDIIGAESLWTKVKDFFGGIKNWVKKSVKKVLNRNKDMDIEEIERVILGEAKLPKFKVNEANLKNYQEIMSEFRNKIEAINESTPNVGIIILNYGIVCARCVGLLNSEDKSVDTSKLPSKLKDSYNTEEVNSIVGALVNIVVPNDSLFGIVEDETYDPKSVTSIIKACGLDNAARVVKEYEFMGELHTNVFFKKYDMIMRSLNEGSDAYMKGFLEGENPDTRFKLLVTTLKNVRSVSIKLTRLTKELYKGVMTATKDTYAE